jgi:hypothetical protein
VIFTAKLNLRTSFICTVRTFGVRFVPLGGSKAIKLSNQVRALSRQRPSGMASVRERALAALEEFIAKHGGEIFATEMGKFYADSGEDAESFRGIFGNGSLKRVLEPHPSLSFLKRGERDVIVRRGGGGGGGVVAEQGKGGGGGGKGTTVGIKVKSQLSRQGKGGGAATGGAAAEQGKGGGGGKDTTVGNKVKSQLPRQGKGGGAATGGAAAEQGKYGGGGKGSTNIGNSNTTKSQLLREGKGGGGAAAEKGKGGGKGIMGGSKANSRLGSIHDPAPQASSEIQKFIK